MNGKSAVVDTNILIYLSKHELSSDFLEQFDYLFVSVITVMELLGYNFESSAEEAFIRELLDFFEVIYVDQEIADAVIEIRKRKRIKLPDAIIAATAINENAHLVTRNVSDFIISNVSILNPFQE